MPATWTRESVCSAVVAAFRRPGGLYLATPGEVEAKLNWRARFPQVDTAAWRFLLSWAECTAGRLSIEERRRERGWTAWEFQQGWRRATDAIAAGLNQESVNSAALIAGEDAYDRAISSGRITTPKIGSVTLISRYT